LAGSCCTGSFLPLVETADREDDVRMFAARCDHEGTQVLLSERRITEVRVERDHVRVRFVCWCGKEGSFREPRRSASNLTGPAHEVFGRRQLA
jgi:hypothetical protein